MGLFSFKKNALPKVEIPADILADVSVNGEQKVRSVNQSVSISAPSSANPNSSTSPFLKSQGQAVQATPEVQEALTPFVEKEPVVEETQKPLQSTVGTSVPDTVHFTDNPSPVSKPANPSIEQPNFAQITQDKALMERKEHLAPTALKQTPPLKKKSFLSSGNIISLVIFLLIVGLISGGSWYYLNTRNSGEPIAEESIGELEQIGVVGEPGESAGSILVDQPNYLKLDVETVTLAQIKELLNAEAQKMTTEKIAVPVEYLVVDTNSNPVAFSRFALLIGAETPNDLVAASLEPFSLYLFLDQGTLRVALAVTLAAETPANFPTNKNALPESMKKFFYPEEYASFNFSNLSFAQSSYQGSTISYVNINLPKNFAFDMTSQEGILTFSNSKSTLRAVIDKRLVVSGQ